MTPFNSQTYLTCCEQTTKYYLYFVSGNKPHLHYSGPHIYEQRIFVTVKALCVVLYIIGAVSLHYTQHIKVDCVTAFR
jgi:hypothetical protein